MKRAAGRFDITRVAHQLRDPLSTIMLWEQLLRISDDPTTRARGLDAIRDSAQAQEKVIDRLAREVRQLRKPQRQRT